MANIDPWAFAASYLDPPPYEPEWLRPNPDPNFKGEPSRLYVDTDSGLTFIRDRARPKQRPPEVSFFIWCVLAGRGFGKSRTGAGWIDYVARQKCVPGEQVLIAGRTPADVRDYALLGKGGLLTNYPDIQYEPSKRLLTWPNKVTALIRSGANPEEFRGFSGQYAWIEELAAWQYPDECWSNLMLGMREKDPRICITTTPKPIPLLRMIMKLPNTIIIKGSSFENAPNLAKSWVENVLNPLKGTRKGRQEVYAELLEDVEGALWRLLTDPETGIPGIDALRTPYKSKLPTLVRTVVGVDPQGVKKDGSMTGIVVAGIDANGRGYVIKDASINGTPGEWSKRVIKMYHRYQADRIVVEKNYGGDMVESTLRTIEKNIPITLVNASGGKIIRAEPVAALYEQFKVLHHGILTKLEDEMIFYEGDGNSPNRLDALVWALTDLMLKKRKRGGTWGTRSKFVKR